MSVATQRRSGRECRLLTDDTPRLTPAEEIELGRRVRAGDSVARERFIRANQGLVVKLAVGYQDLGVPLEDMVSEGNLGLIEAVGRFDPERGIRFSTYASHWIKRAIRFSLNESGHAVRITANAAAAAGKWRKAEAELASQLGYQPDPNDVAKALGMTAARFKTMRLILNAVSPAESLDAPDSVSGLSLADDSEPGPIPHDDDRPSIREVVRDQAGGPADAGRGLSKAQRGQKSTADLEEGELARLAEGLRRNRPEKLQRLAVIRRYVAALRRTHPDLVGRRASGKASGAARRRKAGLSGVESARPETIPSIIGRALGLSASSMRREMRIALTFTDAQLATLDGRGVTTNDPDRIAWIKDADRRAGVVDLIGYGRTVGEATGMTEEGLLSAAG